MILANEHKLKMRTVSSSNGITMCSFLSPASVVQFFISHIFFLQIKLFQLSPFEETVYISSTFIILFMPTITLKFKSRI